MPRAEGPAQVYEVIVSRMPVAPDVLVYDNACKTATFCVSRAPKFFSRTRFIVDRLHWYGHVKCSPIFNSAFYKLMHGVNTQAAE